jgi:PAS domain S-box-containing protein
MWIENIDPEILREVLQESPSCYLISGLDGEIFWANQSFLKWIGYTQGELTKLGWKKISVDNESLSADVEAANDIRTGKLREYYVEKQYTPKNEKPAWGQLVVQRYPVVGEFQFALCHWTPLKNGTATAFTLAMDRCLAIQAELDRMNQVVRSLASETEEQRWVKSTTSMIFKYPRIVLVIIIFVAVLTGSARTIEILQRIGYLPVPAQPVKADAPATGYKIDQLMDAVTVLNTL